MLAKDSLLRHIVLGAVFYSWDASDKKGLGKGETENKTKKRHMPLEGGLYELFLQRTRAEWKSFRG